MVINNGNRLQNHTGGQVIKFAFVESQTKKIVFRRKKDASTWHSHSGCSNWPSSDYFIHKSTPKEPDDKLCEECNKLHEEP